MCIKAFVKIYEYLSCKQKSLPGKIKIAKSNSKIGVLVDKMSVQIMFSITLRIDQWNSLDTPEAIECIWKKT